MMTKENTEYDNFNKKYEKLTGLEESIEDSILEDNITLEDYTLEPLEEIEIDLEDFQIEPLEESKEFKEWKKKRNNMTEEEKIEDMNKTVKDCNLTMIKYLQRRKKELLEEIKRHKEIQKNLKKQYEKTKTKEYKKLLNSHDNLLKQMGHSYKTIDKRINQLKEYIKNV